MKRVKLFYIGTRFNPQLKEPYYVKYGQLSKAEAKRKEKCLYGSMYVEAYETEEDYNKEIAKLQSEGKRINLG